MIRIDTDALFPLLQAAAPAEIGRGRHCRLGASETRSAHGLWPGGLDPVGSRGRLVVPLAGFRPVRRRRDVADRNRDHPVGIPSRELVLGEVLAEPDHRVLVPLVIVRPDVEITRWRVVTHSFELADDYLVIGPASH